MIDWLIPISTFQWMNASKSSDTVGALMHPGSRAEKKEVCNRLWFASYFHRGANALFPNRAKARFPVHWYDRLARDKDGTK
jgi:hypothetical protein